MASKVQKFNFRANFECICVSIPIPAHGFLSESPPYDLSKIIKVSMGYCWHFLLRKLDALKINNGWCPYLDNVGRHSKWLLHPLVKGLEIISMRSWAKFQKTMFRYSLNLHIIFPKLISEVCKTQFLADSYFVNTNASILDSIYVLNVFKAKHNIIKLTDMTISINRKISIPINNL